MNHAMTRSPVARALLASAALASLAACSQSGEIVLNEGVGITAVRSPCPAVGIPDYTGDVTTFRVPGNASAANIDVVAAMTNVRSQCSESSDRIYSNVSFDVLARRTDTAQAQQVTLPYFVSVLQGGNSVVSKRVGSVTVNFAPGQERASASGQGGAYVSRAAATLPADIRERLTRKRRSGDADAALDPLSDPEVRAAVDRASFEVLVGFQLNQGQLAYNATR